MGQSRSEMSKKKNTPESKKKKSPKEHSSAEVDSSSSKFGWIAVLAVLSIVGLVAWFIINGSDEI
jgi:hypothetical protein